LNEYVDIDGWQAEGKSQITILGGFLGQIIIILNAICREFSHLDKPATVKTKSVGKSSES
jgi:hypothetical protein